MEMTSPFSQTYAEARAKFLSLASERGATVVSAVHPTERGAEGIVQAEKALGHLEHADGESPAAARGPYGEGSFAKPFLPGEEPTV